MSEERTGRYRFRRAWLGLFRVLQEEWIAGEAFDWRDVALSHQVPARVFAIVRPSDWLRFAEADKLKARVELAERRAEIARKSRQRRRGEPEFEASRLSD